MFTYPQRSTEDELMDDPAVHPAALAKAVTEVSKVNRLLGGNKVTIDGVRKLLEAYPEKKDWKILDVGCGDGELLRLISDTFSDPRYYIEGLGVDLSAHSIKQASELSKKHKSLNYKVLDILNSSEDLQMDIVVCTLTLHHIPEQDIPLFLKRFSVIAQKGIVINDLHRHKFASLGFYLFSRIFIKSPMARNDGLVSIRRSFIKEDLLRYARLSNVTHFEINWRWAFRWQWIIYPVCP